MKFTIATLLTALMSFAMALFYPWWTIVLASFITSLIIHQSPAKSFLSGFTALSALWCFHALYVDVQNAQLLSSKIAALFKVGSGSALIIITSLIGGISGGLGAITGSFINLSQIFLNKKG